MAKNKAFINQCKMIYRQSQEITPQVYAAVAIAMSRKGMPFEEINEIFADSQEIWRYCLDEGVNMQELCSEETGIDILRTVNE